MRAKVCVLGVALLVLMGCTTWRSSYGHINPPVDQLWVQTPGAWGWIEADTNTYGQWTKDVVITVRVLGPRRLAGSGCRIVLHTGAGDKVFALAPDPEYSWTLTVRSPTGQWRFTVEVGDQTYEGWVSVWKGNAQ